MCVHVRMCVCLCVSPCAVFFPAAFAAARALYGPKPSTRRAFALACTLLNPALVIIDHGHFQYNCISLGCAVGGAAAIAAGWQLLGSFLFCAALNHKQMSLYFAPAFFAHLLGKCLARRGLFNKVGRVTHTHTHTHTQTHTDARTRPQPSLVMQPSFTMAIEQGVTLCVCVCV